MTPEQFDALVDLIASYSDRTGFRDKGRALVEARRMLVPSCQTKPGDMIGG